MWYQHNQPFCNQAQMTNIYVSDSDQDKKFIAEVFSNHLSTTKEIDNSTQVWADEFWWGVDATFSAL